MEEDRFTSFYVSDAVFIFTSALKEVRRYFNMRDCVKNTEFVAGVLPVVRWVVLPLKGSGSAPRLTCLGLDRFSESMMFFLEKKSVTTSGNCREDPRRL